MKARKGFHGLVLWAAALTLSFVALAAPPRKAAQRLLDNVRYYSYPGYTRVVLDLSDEVKIKEKFLQEPSRQRLFFDIPNCRFSPAYPEGKKREIRIESGNLKDIRLGFSSPGNLRIVFDFDRIGKYTHFCLTSPFRIVFDIYREGAPAAGASDTAGPPEISIGANGKPSMARQLGLSVHRIIIDPGHGGKDPGAINPALGLEEKEITLDVARRLQTILAEHQEFQVILTRATDTFVSLEERTAIANSAQGDIFISIHTNSARKRDIRGVESFFLNLTTDPWAMSVAAAENAMSSKSIGELRTILDQIVKDSNVSESQILTTALQKNLVDNLRHKFERVEDNGVKKAPFYVLVGARMPASLVELSFLSHRAEAERLSLPEYRHSLAAGLYLGITSFIQSLHKN